MAWTRIDDKMPSHPKIYAAAHLVKKHGYARVMSMIMEGLCYANAHLTDGFLPETAVKMFQEISKTEVISALIAAKIWHNAEGGYCIHDYHDYQFAAGDIIEIRNKRAESGRIGGLRSAAKRQAAAQANASLFEANAQASAQAPLQAPSNPVPSRPVPSQEDVKEKQELATKIHLSNGKKPPSDVPAAMKHYHDGYVNMHGEKPHITAKDGKLLKALLSQHGLLAVNSRIDNMLHSRDVFIQKSGCTIGILSSQWNKLKSRDSATGKTAGNLDVLARFANRKSV